MKLRMLLPLVLVLSPHVPQMLSALPSQGANVEISLVPGCGGGADAQGNIGGVVTGLEFPEHYKVVVYAHTDWWYVQPMADSPSTDIGSDGKWSNWTHLGSRYAVLVVKDSFSPPARVQTLPSPKDNQDVIAKSETACHS